MVSDPVENDFLMVYSVVSIRQRRKNDYLFRMYWPVMILLKNLPVRHFVSSLETIMEMTVGTTAKKILYIP